MRLTLFICLCITLLFTVVSCKPEKGCNDPANPDCDNYDPCYSKKKLTADFTVQESHWSYDEHWRPYMTDTIASNGATFTAKETGVIYTWKIGSETITTQSFFRQDFPFYTAIPVTLTVKRINNTDCFLGDTIATKTRYIYSLEHSDSVKFNGCYQGYNTDNKADTFTICIKTNDSFQLSNKYHSITGLIKDPACSGKLFLRNEIQQGYKQLYFFVNTFSCGIYPEGIVRIDSIEPNDIIIDYSYLKNTSDLTDKNRVYKTFKGVRIK